MFREGLLRARGQIIFIVALVTSFAIIVWLELRSDEWATGTTLLDRTVDEIVLNERFRGLAEEAYADTGEVVTAAAILALANATALGVVPRDDAIARGELMLDGIASTPDATMQSALIALALELVELANDIEALLSVN